MDNCQTIRNNKVILLLFNKLYILRIKTIIMNHDEPQFEKKLKFSVVEKCPRCGQLSLSFKESKICCSNCGYEEKVPTIR